MTTQIIIHAHAGAQPVFEMMVPFWKRHGLPIVVMCPADSQVQTSLPYVHIGRAGPLGQVAYERWIAALAWMADGPADKYMIFEYDALCLAPEIKVAAGITGVIHLDPQSHWLAHRYPGYPMSIDRQSAARMLDRAIAYPAVTEQGYCDRLYAALAALSGVPVMPWRPYGFCMNTITPNHIPALRKALDNGATMIHGVKSKEALDVCKEYLK